MLRGELRSRSDFGVDRTEYADSGADRADRGECIDLPEREQTCPGGRQQRAAALDRGEAGSIAAHEWMKRSP